MVGLGYLLGFIDVLSSLVCVSSILDVRWDAGEADVGALLVAHVVLLIWTTILLFAGRRMYKGRKSLWCFLPTAIVHLIFAVGYLVYIFGVFIPREKHHRWFELLVVMLFVPVAIFVANAAFLLFARRADEAMSVSRECLKVGFEPAPDAISIWWESLKKRIMDYLTHNDED